MKPLILVIISALYFFNCSGQTEPKTYLLREIPLILSVPNDLMLINITPKPQFLDSRGKTITDSAQIQYLKNTDANSLLLLATIDRKIQISISKIPFSQQLAQFLGDSSNRFKNIKEIAIKQAKSSSSNLDTLSAIIHIGSLRFEKFLLTTHDNHFDFYSGMYLATSGNYYISMGFNCVNKSMANRLISILENAKTK
jgi:hypothetical protein